MTYEKPEVGLVNSGEVRPQGIFYQVDYVLVANVVAGYLALVLNIGIVWIDLMPVEEPGQPSETK